MIKVNITPQQFSQFVEQASEGCNYAVLLNSHQQECTPLHSQGIAGWGTSKETHRLDVINRHVYRNGVPTGQRLANAAETLTLLDDWFAEHPMSFIYAGYEAAWLFEDALDLLHPLEKESWPSLRLIAFENTARMDYVSGELTLTPSPLGGGLGWGNPVRPSTFQAFTPDWLHHYDASFTQEAFTDAVLKIKHHITLGDVYQANLSIAWKKATQHIDPWELFRTLSARNPSPFAGVWKSPQGWILSNSPERLVKQNGDTLETRPIAGTRSRGKNPDEDAANEVELRSLEKERAEHMMLVDLERNDLGRVSEAGSVQVDELMSIERYSHVMHVVSNVIGQRDPNTSTAKILQALFPGGTITGCPKLRCMQVLAGLEPEHRGFYTGSFGFVDTANASMDTNILIRSIGLFPTTPTSFDWGGNETQSYNVKLQAGAGIVHDSVPEHEYRESIKKAKALMEALHYVTD